MLMTDDCSNVSSRANSECEYQYETEHNERQRCLSLKDPVHCIPFHKYLQSQVSKHNLGSIVFLSGNLPAVKNDALHSFILTDFNETDNSITNKNFKLLHSC